MPDIASKPGAHPALESPAFEPMSADETASYDPFIAAALAEDVGLGDVTTHSTIPADAFATATIVAREAGVFAGGPIAARVFLSAQPSSGSVLVEVLVDDGSVIGRGTELIALSGPARAILTGERVALNILSRLSGIASLTRRFADAVKKPYAARITDTRKTTPGLRRLERYAVRAGGGANHRYNLSTAILIKDNHLAVVGSIGEAVRRARAYAGPGRGIEVECESLDHVREAIAAGADAVLLDNMSDAQIRDAVAIASGRVVVEASGGMSISRIGDVSATGVDFISVGALTHSAVGLDIGLDFSVT